MALDSPWELHPGVYTVWDEILHQATASSDIAAYVDWSTGIIRINTTAGEFQKLLKRGPEAQSSPEEGELLETIVHEMYHAIQIVTTGYLYQFVTQLWIEITEWLRSDPFACEGDEFLRAALTAPVPPQLSASLLAWTAALDAPGPEELTTRSILESAAFLVQKRTFDIHIPHDDYLRLLDESSPSVDYRHAYDLAAGYLGDAATDAFPLMTSLALCTLQPPEAFVTLCKGAREQGLISYSLGGTSIDLDGLLALATALPGFVGTATQLADQLPFAHPIYSSGVAAFKQLTSGNRYADWAYMVTPHLSWGTSGELLGRVNPFVFNFTRGRLTMILPEEIRSGMSQEEQTRYAHELVAIAAIHARTMQWGEPSTSPNSK